MNEEKKVDKEYTLKVIEVVFLFGSIIILIKQNCIIRKQTYQLILQTEQLILQNKLGAQPIIGSAVDSTNEAQQNLMKNIGKGPALNILYYTVTKSPNGSVLINRSVTVWYSVGVDDNFNLDNFTKVEQKKITNEQFYQAFPEDKINLDSLAPSTIIRILKYADVFKNCYATILTEDRPMKFEQLGTCLYIPDTQTPTRI